MIFVPFKMEPITLIHNINASISISEFEEEEGKLVRNQLSGTLEITTIPNDVQDEFLDLKHDSAVKYIFEEKYMNVFWCSMHQSYPKVSEIALRLLALFNYLFM